MLNFWRVMNLQFSSALARKVFGYYYRAGRTYVIPFGPLRGCRLRYEKMVTFHAMLGLLDRDIFRVMERVLVRSGSVPRNATVADVGANIGIYTLWFARVMAPRGRVYAFEPGPLALVLLKESVAVNRLANVEIEEQACGAEVGLASFHVAANFHTSSLVTENCAQMAGSTGTITVRQITLDAYFAEDSGRPAPDMIKMDIEGGGVFALPGCGKTVRRKRPFILIESHTPKEDRAISDLLLEHDYEAYRLTNRQWVGRREETHPTADGVWGTLLLCPREKADEIRRALG